MITSWFGAIGPVSEKGCSNFLYVGKTATFALAEHSAFNPNRRIRRIAQEWLHFDTEQNFRGEAFMKCLLVSDLH